MPQTLAARPDHVKPELVREFDFYHPSGIEHTAVHLAWNALHAEPDIFWTPYYGGHWVLTRGEDIKLVQGDTDRFSNAVVSLPREEGRTIRMAPLEIDVPEHAAFRTLLNPAFTPRAVRVLEENARKLAIALIDDLVPNGHCDFVSDFAQKLPTTVFLQMMNLPLEQRAKFVGWAGELLHAAEGSAKAAAMGKIMGYLAQVIAERTAVPGDDLISKAVQAKASGQLKTDEDVLGLVAQLFVGGLDTVANMLSFSTWYLAENPLQRQRLIEDPALIPAAAEEFLRRFAVASTTRVVKEDTEVAGAFLRKGDIVMVSTPLAGLDDRLYEKPLDVDFNRRGTAHNSFGNGPHRCVGAPLARAELKIFLEEWLKRVPAFSLAPGTKVETRSGSVLSVVSLPLVWSRSN